MPIDENESMFQEDPGNSFKNNDLPDFGLISRALSPLKNKIMPIVNNELNKVTDLFT